MVFNMKLTLSVNFIPFSGRGRKGEKGDRGIKGERGEKGKYRLNSSVMRILKTDLVERSTFDRIGRSYGRTEQQKYSSTFYQFHCY